MFNNSLSILNTESWFIPVDIFNITCLVVTSVLALLFLFIIAIHKTCHTVPMLLVANSCLAVLDFSSCMIWTTVITLQNDLKQVDYQDPLCIVRGYFGHASCGILNYAFLLEALYRYIIVVYPTRLFWRSGQSQLLLIIIMWTSALIFPFAFIFTGDISYNVNNQICLVPLRFSFPTVFVAVCGYGIPISMVILIYMKLVQHVKRMKACVISANILLRAQRELKMVRRTVSIVMILLIFGVPYSSLIVVSFFTSPPVYHYRIALSFCNDSLIFIMIAIFQFTEPLKTAIMKKLNKPSNHILPAIT